MPRGYGTKSPERVAEVQRLRAQGWMYKEIGAALGISTSTVDAWLKDPDGEMARARKLSYRGVCEECGGPTTGCNGRAQAPPRCLACCAIWTRDALLAAIRDWAEEHGGVPPTQIAWNPAHPRATPAQKAEYATGRWPSHTTVRGAFGSWNGGLIAAGFVPHRVKHMGREVLDDWRESVLRGERVVDIAARYDVTPEAVYLRLATHGTPVGQLRREAA